MNVINNSTLLVRRISDLQRRRDILDAARERFVTDGYSRARLNDVAADAWWLLVVSALTHSVMFLCQ